MKKFLLVLLMITIASFFFIGCLPVTPSEGEGEGEGEGEVEVVMTIEDEYTNAAGETFVACGKDVTVTFPSPVDIDHVVYVAVKVYYEGAKPPPSEEGEYYECMEALTPNADRTVWTIEGYTGECICIFNDKQPIECIWECEPFCLVALVKHPCCPGEEVALRVVSADCTAPYLNLFVKITDCEDPCAEPDPCDPPFAGVSIEWTSRTTDICETEDCCGDTCSGVNGWSLVIDPDECEGPCDTITGTGCPVEGVLGCECLAYTDTGEICYFIDFSFEDNVGNTVESTWELCLDTDSVVYFGGASALVGVFSFDGEWFQVYNDCKPFNLD